MFVFSLVTMGMEIYRLVMGKSGEEIDGAFAVVTILFFFFYSLLRALFGAFVEKKAAAVFSVLPSVLLLFLFRKTELLPYTGKFLMAAILLGAVLRLLMEFLPRLDLVMNAGSLVMAIGAACMYFGLGAFKSGHKTVTWMFVFLAVLTLCALQKFIFEKKSEGFPFFFFLIMEVLLLAVPVREEPINWTPVLDMGKRMTDGVVASFDSVSYLISDHINDQNYITGYNALGKTGGKVSRNDRTQLVLRSSDKPYYVFKDEDSDLFKLRRKVLYLAGGKGEETSQLIRFATLLHANNVNRDYASVFSQKSKVSIEYSLLKTPDEIAPINTFALSDNKGRVKEGSSLISHKKGYRLEASYLDIDYGSPYLMALLEAAEGTMSGAGEVQWMDYEECCEYLLELYDIRLNEIVSRDEYLEILDDLKAEEAAYTKAAGHDGTGEEWLDTTGATPRMVELSEKLCKDTAGTFERCKMIEAYLRQYNYSTDLKGKDSFVADMSTAEGLSSIADLFLFESGKGYCVHYTSAMVMLLRLSGIPARAVSGYRYSFPFEPDELYKVSGNYAHTWPEAYIEGVGWVPFEPTSSCLPAEERTWNRAPKEEKELAEVPVLTQYGDYPSVSYGAPENILFTEEEEKEEDDHGITLGIARILISVSIFIILLLLLLIFGTRLIRELKYARGTNERKLIMDVEQIKKSIMKLSKDGFEDRGLLSDYEKRTPGELRSDAGRVFASYYRLNYARGAEGITDEESRLAKELREKLLGYGKK